MTGKCESCNDDSCEVEGTVKDFVTGKKVVDTLAERVRQKTERFLVERKNYSKSDIEVGVEFEVIADNDTLKPKADLIISVGDRRVIIIKCVYGALLAGERLILSYARLIEDYQIPFAVVTNETDANIIDTISGEVIGSGADAIPKKDDLNINKIEFKEYPKDRITREKRILNAFESIDESMCSTIRGWVA